MSSDYVTSLTFPKLIMKKALIAITALTASALIAGCANVPREAHRINLITLDEAEANHCKSLGWVGSVSVLLINGKARNTAVILKKAVKMPGATHIAYQRRSRLCHDSRSGAELPEPRPENKRSGNDGLSARIPKAQLTLESICSTAFAINQLFRA